MDLCTGQGVREGRREGGREESLVCLVGTVPTFVMGPGLATYRGVLVRFMVASESHEGLMDAVQTWVVQLLRVSSCCLLSLLLRFAACCD